MGKSVKILAIAGSSRKDSLNKKLLAIAVKSAEAVGAEVTVLDLKEYPLPFYDGDLEEQEGLPSQVLQLKKIFLENSGLLIASPEYNSSISGVLKNLIDWVSRPIPNQPYLVEFKDKIAALFSASPGNFGGMRGLVHLRALLGNIGIMCLPDQVCVSNAAQAFNAEGQLSDDAQQKKVQKLSQSLTQLLQKTQQ